MKKILSMILSFLLLFSCIGAYASEMYVVEQKDITVTYNGDTIAFPDAQPLIQNGKTLVPVRAIMERAKLTVDFDGAARKVTAGRDGFSIVMFIDSTEATVANGDTSQTITLEEPARIIDGRTFVPVRFIAESMNLAVNWNPNYREVIIIDTAEWEQEISGNSTLLSYFLDLSAHPRNANTSNFSGAFSFSFADESGDKTVSVNMSGTEVFDGESTGMNLTLNADLSSLKTLLSGQEGMDEKTLDILCKAHSINLDIVLDRDWNLYIQSPDIVSILKDCGQTEAADKIGTRYVKVPLNEWFAAMFSLDAEAMAGSHESAWDFLEAMITADKTLYSQSVAMIDDMIAIAAQMYHDDTFTKSEQADGSELWHYTPDKAEYNSLLLKMNQYISAILGAPMDDAQIAEQKKTLENTDTASAITMTVSDDKAAKIEISRAADLVAVEAPANAKYSVTFGISNQTFDNYKDEKISTPESTVDLEELLGGSLNEFFAS